MPEHSSINVVSHRVNTVIRYVSKHLAENWTFAQACIEANIEGYFCRLEKPFVANNYMYYLDDLIFFLYYQIQIF